MNSPHVLSADLQAGGISFPSRRQQGRSGRGAAGSPAPAGRPSGSRAGTERWLLAWGTWGSPESSAPLLLQGKRGSETPSASNAPRHHAASAAGRFKREEYIASETLQLRLLET